MDVTTLHIPITDIVTGLNNRTRFPAEQLQSLADDMHERGLLQPIVVRPHPTGQGWQLIAGERRWRAAHLLGWTTIPAIVHAMDDRAARSAMMAENTHRADIDPIDEANGYAAFIADFGVTSAEVARTVGVDVQRVNRRLSLRSLLPELQTILRTRPELIVHMELLTRLDRNYQHAALTTLTQRSEVRLPEFRRIVHALLERQAQEAQLSIFDAELLGGHFAEQLQEAATGGGRLRIAHLPIDPRFPHPKVRERRRFLANQWRDWADALALAGFAEGAAAVYTLIEVCIAEGRIEANESEWVGRPAPPHPLAAEDADAQDSTDYPSGSACGDGAL
ncbi:MAG: ParB/RepB/Spo0J family partition protein [Candidatus Viridilinea halotolerans]|uniref:ParB/RepB/Spo0J family partition protein n=1 Tax=Candidatus Viridilinea halotolerans TaxID=2491704 RepID=A0A426U8S1_9CHLR|nr:MAG: ParB/RepB/Spo0J family partition protein [Candidatus Viridilinea halotolerans]